MEEEFMKKQLIDLCSGIPDNLPQHPGLDERLCILLCFQNFLDMGRPGHNGTARTSGTALISHRAQVPRYGPVRLMSDECILRFL